MRYKITRTAAYMASQENQSPELKHYGVKGMKWGEKKFGKGPGLDDRFRNDEELTRAARAAQPTRPQINTRQKLSQLLGSAQSKVSGSSAAAKAMSKTKAKPKVSDALLERVFGKTKEVNKINTNPLYPHKQTRTTATVKVPGLVTPAIDGGRKLVDTTVTGAKNIGSGIVKTASSAYNDAKKWVDGAIGTIGKKAVQVGDTAKSAYSDAKKWVDGLFSKTESVERGGLGAAKVYKKGGIEKAYDSAKAGITKTATQVGDAAKTAYGDAKKWVDGALKTAGGAADEVGKTVTKTAQQAVRSGRIAVDNLLTGHKKHPTHEQAVAINRGKGPMKTDNELWNPKTMKDTSPLPAQYELGSDKLRVATNRARGAAERSREALAKAAGVKDTSFPKLVGLTDREAQKIYGPNSYSYMLYQDMADKQRKGTLTPTDKAFLQWEKDLHEQNQNRKKK